jgi:hypothetical protein
MRQTQIAATLAALATMSSEQLRAEWCRTTGKPLPRVSPAMLRLAFGYELQVLLHGGLSRQTRKRLDQLRAARSETRSTVPGMRLVREHNGNVQSSPSARPVRSTGTARSGVR